MTPSVPSPDSMSLGDRIWSRVLVLVLGSAVALAEVAGVDRTLRFGAAFGRAWHRLRGPRTERVRSQLRAAFPEGKPVGLGRVEVEVFTHLGQGIAEVLLMLGRHRTELVASMEVIGLEHLEGAVRESGGLGAVVIGPHLGNWELGAAKLASMGVPVSAVYRGIREPSLERAIVAVRGGSPGESTSGKDEAIEQIAMGRRAGVQFVRALEAGRNVLVLLDQRARRGEGLSVDFFGRPANTRFGPLKLAGRIGAPVLMAFARREPDGRRHTLTFYPALDLERGGSDDEDVLRRNLQRVTTEIENEIRKVPGQWIWTHRRWREPPPPSGTV